MRLIDADALKEAMNEHTDYKGYLVCDPEEIIDLAPTVERPHGKWIPCSERLPEEDGEYLIEWDAGWGAEIHIADYSQGGKYWYRDATGYEYRGVIAWMPLPEPYKKEGEAE